MNMNITHDTIRACQNGGSDAALVRDRLDGTLTVLASLAEALPLAPTTELLRHPARTWADELVAIARETAEAEGGRTHLATLRATAAALAVDEFAEELHRDAVQAPGRHVELRPGDVVLTAADVAAWRALLDELEPLVYAAHSIDA